MGPMGNISEQGFRGAGIRSTNADGLGNRRSNAVYGHVVADASCLRAATIENDGELHERGTR